MRATRTLEIGTGLFVLLGFAALFFLTTQLPTSGLRLGGATGGYSVTAEFDNVGDLKTGSPVTMAGVRIGEVEAIRFDSQSYKAVATLRIDPQFSQIPDDSDASVQTQGLLGGKYIGIGPGGSDTYLADGGRIELTQSALVLENLVNRLFASLVSSDRDAPDTEEASGDGDQ
jgi:phospholipid/cholesterol/gamma-HCH transport system substrate-binding protein